MRTRHNKLKDACEYLILGAITSVLSAYWLITGKIGMGSRYRFGVGVTSSEKARTHIILDAGRLVHILDCLYSVARRFGFTLLFVVPQTCDAR